MNFSFTLRRESGQVTVAGLAISLLILVAAFAAYGYKSRSSYGNLEESLQIAIAGNFAVELLEFFRSMNKEDLRNYLNNLPTPIPMCAHINILDRPNNKIWNPDPIANLPLSRLDLGSAAPNSNRYYQVQVVDSITLAEVPGTCDAVPPFSVLPSTQTYSITVRVKWLSHPSGREKVKSLNTVLIQ